MRFPFAVLAGATVAALASVASAATFTVTVDGGDAIFLAGRTDVVIPDLGDPWADNSAATDDGLRRHSPAKLEGLETLPPALAVTAGDVVRVLDPATGGIDFFNAPSANFFGPEGNAGATSSNLSPLGGISGYQGTQGALTGVFLTDDIPNDVNLRPDTLQVSDYVGGLDYAFLTPEIGQVFYIGDGTTSLDPSGFKQITAPETAARVLFGIPDGFSFGGVPGAYDDNNGSYEIRVGINSLPDPSAIPLPASALLLLTGLGALTVRRQRARAA